MADKPLFPYRLLIGVVLAGIFLTAALAVAKPFKLGFFHMRSPETAGGFWTKFTNCMQAACEDFGIELKIYYAQESAFLMKSQVQQAAINKEVDVLVFQNFANLAPQFFQIAENNHIPAFLVNSGVPESAGVGNPREKFSYWVGEMVPDDQWAGYTLGKMLADTVIRNQKTAAGGKVRILGFAGNPRDGASILREKGLRQLDAQREDILVQQIIPAKWQPEIAASQYVILKKRFPEINAIWSANDQMLVGKYVDGKMVPGVLAEIQKGQLVPGKNIFLGGINWTPQAIDAIRQGVYALSLGGHFLEGAWAVVVLYDYFNGIDFASETVSMRSKMGIITPQNITLGSNIDTIFEKKEISKLDFRKFSKKCNPNLGAYNFSVNLALEN